MGERPAFRIQITSMRGKPAGLRIIGNPNKSGRGLAFPKASLYKVRQQQEELQGVGVYVLLGPAKSEDLRQVYVGQTTGLGSRLNNHTSEKDKNFWNDTVVFVNPNLNAGHFQYLEAELCRLAKEANRCELTNITVPRGDKLPDEDKEKADPYLEDILLYLQILGVHYFEKASERESPPPKPKGKGTAQPPKDEQRRLFLKSSKEVIATGYYLGEGKLRVEAGPKAPASVSNIPKWSDRLLARRDGLVAAGVLKDKGDYYELVKNHDFSRPSIASDLLLGRPSNGWDVWKDAQGVRLKDLESRPKGKSA